MEPPARLNGFSFPLFKGRLDLNATPPSFSHSMTVASAPQAPNWSGGWWWLRTMQRRAGSGFRLAIHCRPSNCMTGKYSLYVKAPMFFLEEKSFHFLYKMASHCVK